MSKQSYRNWGYRAEVNAIKMNTGLRRLSLVKLVARRILHSIGVRQMECCDIKIKRWWGVWFIKHVHAEKTAQQNHAVECFCASQDAAITSAVKNIS